MTIDQLEKTMNELTVRQLLLLRFVQSAHSDQVRKYTGEPYFHHVLEVGVMAEEYVPSSLLLEVGLCHDLFEDTLIDKDDLFSFLLSNQYSKTESLFILNGAYSLTDRYTSESEPNKNRDTRKRMEAARLSQIHFLYQSVKYADLINNTLSIVEYDQKFAKIYLQEKEYMLQKMRYGDIELFIECWNVLKRAKEMIARKA